MRLGSYDRIDRPALSVGVGILVAEIAKDTLRSSRPIAAHLRHGAATLLGGHDTEGRPLTRAYDAQEALPSDELRAHFRNVAREATRPLPRLGVFPSVLPSSTLTS